MRITFKSLSQLQSAKQRSYAGKNRIDTSSRNDLKIALRRIKEGNLVNMREADALMKNGYNVDWKGEERGIITIDGVAYNLNLQFDSLASNY